MTNNRHNCVKGGRCCQGYYDEAANQSSLHFTQVAHDPVRMDIDEAVAQAVGLPDYSILRELLGRERNRSQPPLTIHLFVVGPVLGATKIAGEMIRQLTTLFGPLRWEPRAGHCPNARQRLRC